MKILIVEDQPLVATLLQRHLEGVSSDISIADTMAMAKQFTKETKQIHLITVDLSMPDSTVNETIDSLSEIRELQPDAVVIIISGYVDESHEKEILSAGADGLIPKSGAIERSTLLSRLMSIVRMILSAPPRFHRQLAVAQFMADRLTASLADEQPPRDMRASLA